MTKAMFHIYLCLGGIFLIPLASTAQHILSGYITTPQKIPVANASIKIKDSLKGLPLFFAISDANGAYQLKIPAKPKTYWIECSLIGFRSTSLQFTLSAGDSLRHSQKEIVLIPDTATLPEINVYSIPPVTVSGDTTTFRVDAFKKGNETNVSDLLNAIPGFTVNNGRISYSGRAVTKVLIEEDDLFGSDYTTVTQNLSPKGIEKIQLIENYNDKTYLSNRIQKGSELVVNLKFDRKYLYRIIASNEAGISISPAIDFYKIRQNIVSLIPRVKFITTTNFNNTGLLATEILGTTSTIPELAILRKDGINFDLLPRFAAGPIEQLPDISSQIVPKNKMTANHSSVITTNGIYKASKKLLFKGIFQYYRDAFEQRQLQTVDYTVSGTNLIVTNTQFLRKEIPIVNASFESIFSPSTFTQIVYKAHLSTQNEQDSLGEFKQAVNTYTTYKDHATRFHQQLGFSFAIDSNRIVDIRGMHITESSQQSPLIYPANIYKAFTFDSLSSHIASSIQTDHLEYKLQAKLTTKRKKSNWALEFLHTVSNLQLTSGADFIEKDSLKKINDDSVRNDAVLKTHISDIVLWYNVAISKKIYLRTAQRIENGNLFFNNHNRIEQGKSYTYYLPSLNLNFSLSQNKTIGLSIDCKSKLPGIYDPSNGYIFATGSSIIRGDSSLQFGISKVLSLSYSYVELVKKKLTWNIVGFYSREPILYIAEQNPDVFYTIINKFTYGRDMTMLALTSNVSQYVSAIKSQISFELQANSLQNFYSNKNQSGSIALSNFSPTLKCKTIVTNNLTASASVKAAFVSQVFDKGLSIERKNTSQIFTYTTELVYRASHSWVFNARYQYITQTQAAKKYDLHMGEMAIKYIAIKDKLHFVLSGNNIFNKNYFNSVSFSQYTLNTQSIAMIRPYLMLHATVEF